MKKFILGMIVFVAFIFVVGSVGAFDSNTISFAQLLIQCAIGIGTIWVCMGSMNKEVK